MTGASNKGNLILNSIMALALLAAAATVYFLFFSSTGEKFVYFDTHKLLNAQKKASLSIALDNPQSTWRIQTMNAKIEREVQDAIRSVAGGAFVLSKSSVVLLSDYRDITNEVLILLNLPTDVPDVDAIGSVPVPIQKSEDTTKGDAPGVNFREKYLP